MKNPPVVRVEWVDTRMYPGWQDGQQAYEPVTVVNVGFLLNDDDHSKQTYNVAAQWSPEFGAGADVTVIPMGCVTDIDDLTTLGDVEFDGLDMAIKGEPAPQPPPQAQADDDAVIAFDTPEFDNPIPRDYAGSGRVLAFPARNPVDCPQWCPYCREDRFVENLLSSEYFCSNSWCCGNEDEREKYARDRFLQYRDDPEEYEHLAKYDTFGKES